MAKPPYISRWAPDCERGTSQKQTIGKAILGRAVGRNARDSREYLGKKPLRRIEVRVVKLLVK